MNRPALIPTILYEDNHCLVVDKPAGLLSQGDDSGDPSLVDWARADLKRRHHKPGNVYVGLVHRLDRPTSGVVLLARTSKAAARLSERFRNGEVEKTYWAIVEGPGPAESEGVLNDVLRKDQTTNRVEALAEGEEGQAALLEFRVLRRQAGRTWLEVRPRTGRGHQIRVQLASRGWPIVGDRKYGAKSSLKAADGGFRIALHAVSLRFPHPTRPEAIEVAAPAPADWPEHTGRPAPLPPE